MEISLLLAGKIAAMLIMVLMGYVLTKKGIMNDSSSSLLSLIALYLVNPCKLITAYIVDYDPSMAFNLVLLFVFAAGVHMLLIVLSKPIGRIFGLNPACKGSIIYSNCGNLIMPIIGAVLGEDSLFYSSAFYAVQNIFIWTHLQVLMGNSDGMSLKKVLLNPNVAAIIIGLIIFLTGIHPTGPLYSAIVSVGDMTGPVAMLITGSIIAYSDVRAMFVSLRIWVLCAIRLIFYPVIIILVLKVLNIDSFIGGFNRLALVGFLAAAAPTATSVVQLAKLNNGDYESANAVNIMTILLCIITMPLTVYLYQMILL